MKQKEQVKIALAVSIRIRYLFQDKGVRGKELLKIIPKCLRRSIYRHTVRAFDSVEGDKRKPNPGRPRKLTDRDERAINQEIPKLRDSVGSFTTKSLKVTAGINERVCDETLHHTLKKFGYGYYHSCKKGLLKIKDVKARRKKSLEEKIWTEDVTFYFDGATFQHKYNAFDEAKSTRTMAWRKKSEGLDLKCTAKGSHVGSGGKVAHFLVAVSFNRRVILCEQYHGNINDEMFEQFILEHFNNTFEKSANPKQKLFLLDGDPSQNSKKAKVVLDSIAAEIFSIPPCSPDMNLIENIFNVTKEMLHADALNKNITKENFEEYLKCVKETLHSISLETVNKTMDLCQAAWE